MSSSHLSPVARRVDIQARQRPDQLVVGRRTSRRPLLCGALSARAQFRDRGGKPSSQVVATREPKIAQAPAAFFSSVR
jgi:hypothetical protein